MVLDAGTGSLKRIYDETNIEVVVDGFEWPMVLVMTGDRQGYVTDSASGVIYEVDIMAGIKTVVASGLSAPEGIDLYNDNFLVVAETGMDRLISVRISNGTIEPITEIPMGSVVQGVPGGLFSGVAVSKNRQEIYVTSDMDNTVYKLEKAAK